LLRFASRKYGWKPHKKAALAPLNYIALATRGHSFTSACTNAGEDVTTVALAQAQNNSHSSTIHSSIHPTDDLKVQPALKVARRLADDEVLEDVELKGDV
jgi:hypothetical protein